MRLVVRATDPALAHKTAAWVEQAGLKCAVLAGLEAASPAAGGEDVALLPGTEANDPQLLDLRAALDRPDGPLASVALVDRCDGPFVASPFTAVLPQSTPAPGLLRRVQDAYRLEATAWEAGRLAQAAGLAPTVGLSPEPAHLLWIGTPAAQYLPLTSLAPAFGFLPSATFTTFSAFDHLHQGTAEAALVNALDDPSRALAFCMALRRNAQLHFMPAVMLARADDDRLIHEAFSRGACAVVHPEGPFGPALALARAEVAADRRRKGLERLLQRARERLSDVHTGLLQAEAFTDHLATMARDCTIAGKPLALAVLRMDPAPGAPASSAAVWKRGLREIGSIVARLARASDIATMIQPGVFLIASAAEALGTADILAERIAGVSESTVFGGGESGVGPVLFERRTLALAAGETGTALLSRALDLFELESRSA